MSMSFQHPSYQSRLGDFRSDEEGEAPRPEPAAVYRPAVRYARRACCCPARPAVIAVMSAANGRSAPVDLLLCGHHYRQSRQALAASGAAFLDMLGYPLDEQAWPPAR